MVEVVIEIVVVIDWVAPAEQMGQGQCCFRFEDVDEAVDVNWLCLQLPRV